MARPAHQHRADQSMLCVYMEQVFARDGRVTKAKAAFWLPRTAQRIHVFLENCVNWSREDARRRYLLTKPTVTLLTLDFDFETGCSSKIHIVVARVLALGI